MEEFIPADAMGIACWIIDDRSNPQMDRSNQIKRRRFQLTGPWRDANLQIAMRVSKSRFVNLSIVPLPHQENPPALARDSHLSVTVNPVPSRGYLSKIP